MTNKILSLFFLTLNFYREKEGKEGRKELAEKMYPRQGKISPPFAAPRSHPFLQHRKTYR